jgi:hypothetical protein
MTVASQVKQTLASLKGVEATIETYALHHPDQETKEEFRQCKDNVKKIVDELEKRVGQMELEEPQYMG